MVGQAFAYRAGIRPNMDYEPAARPRLTKRQLVAVVIRTIGYTAAGHISALAADLRARVGVAVKIGLVMGAVTAVSSACMPFIEWSADRVPEKRMGVFG